MSYNVNRMTLVTIADDSPPPRRVATRLFEDKGRRALRLLAARGRHAPRRVHHLAEEDLPTARYSAMALFERQDGLSGA